MKRKGKNEHVLYRSIEPEIGIKPLYNRGGFSHSRVHEVLSALRKEDPE
jgi:hypothetical protein